MRKKRSGVVSATKEFTLDFAHMLAGHEGLCRNVHGHTYKVQVCVAYDGGEVIESGPAEGMVIDFKQLKEFVTREIIDAYDHAFVTWKNSPDPIELQIAKLLKENGRKIVEVDFRPTAENFAFDWFDRLTFFGEDYNLIIESVKVWETPTSFATAGRDI